MLTIPSEAIPALQAKLAELEKRQAARNALTPQIEQAQATISRLRAQMGDLAKQGADHGARTPEADPGRLTQLLAGGDVPPIDTVAEARLAKFQDIDAQRGQFRRDLEAVTRHLGRLQAQAQAADREVSIAYADFLDDLGDAVVMLYQQAARDFVATFIPALYSICYRRRQATGGINAPWFGRIIPGGASLCWAEPDPIIDGPGLAPRPNMTVLWPRMDLKLVSGEPVESDAVIDALMENVRTAPTRKGKAAPAAA